MDNTKPPTYVQQQRYGFAYYSSLLLFTKNKILPVGDYDGYKDGVGRAPLDCYVLYKTLQ
jgi:hypothetical protein